MSPWLEQMGFADNPLLPPLRRAYAAAIVTTPWTMQALSGAEYSAVELSEDGSQLFVLDQRRLPEQEHYLRYQNVSGAAVAIRDMVVRGAPAIGITAGYGMAMAAKGLQTRSDADYLVAMNRAAEMLVATRPTAVNLSWAVARCLVTAERHAEAAGERRWQEMAALAREIHRDDVEACRSMGRFGAELLPPKGGVLTHCNAGALATGGYGTALGVLRAAKESGRDLRVLASETRPYLQGARLTAWELARDGIDVTVITDSMVAHCMKGGQIGAVVVGADRIARNGDVANKIGTYGIACLASLHDIPFYVAAPWSTVDLSTATGEGIPIEERPADELAQVAGRRIVPAGVPVYNPAFDVTPASLIRAIVTERGVFEASGLAGMAAPWPQSDA